MRLPGLQTDTEGEVTPSDFNKAALAIFAAKAAGPGASFEQMKGICCCIRNRVREGWGEWLDVIEAAEDDKANLPGPRVRLDTENKSLRRLMQEIDDIYYGEVSRLEDRAAHNDSLWSSDGGQRAQSFPGWNGTGRFLVP